MTHESLTLLYPLILYVCTMSRIILPLTDESYLHSKKKEPATNESHFQPIDQHQLILRIYKLLLFLLRTVINIITIFPAE